MSNNIPSIWECYKESLTRPFNIRDSYKNNCGHKFGLVSASIGFFISSIVCYVVYKQKKTLKKEGGDKTVKKEDDETILILTCAVILFTIICYFSTKYGYEWKVSVNNMLGRKLLGNNN